LLEACIERIEAVNPSSMPSPPPAMNAPRRGPRGRAGGADGEPLGLLHGLPLGVKDLEPTAGLLSTYGSPQYRNNIPAQDIELVARLRRAGAIVTGKTNVPEMGPAPTRATRCGAPPATPSIPGSMRGLLGRLGRGAGGRHAARVHRLGHRGSLRIPAAKCGVVGFRPSPGVVPSVRKLLGWTPISVVGPMGRTVDDACLQLAATAGSMLAIR
jgi:Asp-tRNA(Asn)/Glu-tRNA(Gln) amidotransferase A subunit family amidase